MKRDRVSKPVVERLPKYYACVDELYRTNCIRVSSSTLSRQLGFTASQIRQDFSCFGEFGQQGYGYNVKKLRQELREILGMESGSKAILIGCGHLGHALLQNFDFSACGFQMLAAFDRDINLVGTKVGGYPVIDIVRLGAFMERFHPEMAVLTLPERKAEEVAEDLCKMGIRAIWNFTAAPLDFEEEGVAVEQVSFMDSLLRLSYHMNENAED